MALAAGYYLRASKVAPHSDTALFAATLSDLDGKAQNFQQWRGKIIVVNFWATWCPPCRVEIPEFIKLQNEYRDKGVVFVGIALDQTEKVRPFVKEAGINYPILLGGADVMALAQAVGNKNGGLPYTVVVDRVGKIVFKKLGTVSYEQLEKQLLSLL